MTFFNMLYTLIFEPLVLFFEFIFSVAYRMFQNPPAAIVFLSLSMNFLVLPLYRRADALQEKQRKTEEAMAPDISFLKKTFKGDERYMMIQTYYRQHHYKPIYALRGSLSLALEIPFFIAAYQFLSGLSLLKGVSFGPIADLSSPDRLLTLFGSHVNVLPLLMTLINFFSGAIYCRGYSAKTKIQLYGTALVFMVLLYESPSGLVFYWTLNNLFSLAKNIFYKIKNPHRVLDLLGLIAGVILTGWGTIRTCIGKWESSVPLILLGLAIWIPALCRICARKKKKVRPVLTKAPNRTHFLLSGLMLAILIGLLVPSAVVNSSPLEFMDTYNFVHPIWYVVRCFLLGLGTFLLWFGVFYYLADERGRVRFEAALRIACLWAAINYLFFGQNLGVLSSDLVYENGLSFRILLQVANGLLLVLLAVLLLTCLKKLQPHLQTLITVGLAAFCIMSVVNVRGIVTTVASTEAIEANESNAPHFTLSKTGKNVVVIMLDRAMGEYMPYIFNEDPELQTEFSGFTLYTNTVAFGAHTIFATPALFGGYEYTPVEMNLRSGEKLSDKHNEALTVMPRIFLDAGFDVTVCDAPYAGYSEVPNLSIYDTYPEIQTYLTEGYFVAGEAEETALDEALRHNFFFFSIMKALPISVQNLLYNGGHYCQTSSFYSGQTKTSKSTASGLNGTFMKSYNVLSNLSTMTRVSEDGQGGFMMMDNNQTHNVMLLQTPEYLPAEKVDNTEYDAAHADRFTVDGKTLPINSAYQMSMYHTNMAAMQRLGDWFTWLKAQGVYDNTRIILVSDHGYPMEQFEELLIDETATVENHDHRQGDVEFYYPMLLVKDYDATGFTMDDTFMTTADVPTLATEGVIEDPVNPFTGKAINADEKTAHDQYILASYSYGLTANSGNTFRSARWYSVHDNIWDRNNWKLEAEDAVLPFGEE